MTWDKTEGGRQALATCESEKTKKVFSGEIKVQVIKYDFLT